MIRKRIRPRNTHRPFPGRPLATVLFALILFLAPVSAILLSAQEADARRGGFARGGPAARGPMGGRSAPVGFRGGVGSVRYGNAYGKPGKQGRGHSKSKSNRGGGRKHGPSGRGR